MAVGRFSRAHEEILIELYKETPATLDELPYTDEFDRLHASFVDRSGRQITKHDLWRGLTNLRKAGRLPRKQR